MSPKALPGTGIFRGRRNVLLWTIVVAVVALALLGLAVKPEVQTWLKSGDTIKAAFSANDQLYPNESKVKLDGLDVGVVTDVTPTQSGPVVVTMKVDSGTLEKLGSQPRAAIEPTTVLGGIYSVSLSQGGHSGTYDAATTIPVERTSTPVELDRVLEALPPSALTGLQSTVKNLDQSLRNGAGAELDTFAQKAPDVMQNGGQVLDAVQGTRPYTDLQSMVTNVDSLAGALSKNDGQLDGIMRDLDTTTRALAGGSKPLASAISTLPQTLVSTRTGMQQLGQTLDELTATAPAFIPAAGELTPALKKLSPVVAQARPVVHDLVPLLDDAQPLVEQLVPASKTATGVLDDVRGPVLDRVNGPIMSALLNTWHGTGPYEGDGGGDQADQKFYQEIAYTFAGFDNVAKIFSKNGYTINFALGTGTSGIETGKTPLVGQLPLVPQLLQNLGKPSGGQ
ncbi:MCE family protein [Amycolatopsis sp. K13G38]|uniref:MCE family protein n=1 Tax=Amycolatopsis acididurans TaxID=2724524 RepID=A0ABX1J0C0_9PSEU|nr:MlaD family protein [Amycolatopsis acididurans]NKQ53217.1 MCE family protein [Amycolatopsis acididurans]